MIKRYIEYLECKHSVNESKGFDSREQVSTWLIDNKIMNYTINEDLSVDVDDKVNISVRALSEIPIKFNIVKGGFYCSWNQLTSLSGCPKSVGGGFNCYYNLLTSLEYCPQYIGGTLDCQNNSLTSLIGLPIDFNLTKLKCDYDTLKWYWLETILSDDESLIKYNIDWINKKRRLIPKSFEDKYGYLLDFEHYTKILKN